MKRTIVAFAFVSAAGAANAQNLLVNPGFEIPPTAAGAAVTFGGGSNIGGWTVLGPGNAVSVLNTAYAEPGNGMSAFQAHGGSNSLDTTGPGNTGTSSGIQQAVATAGGGEYLLSFFVGRAQSSTGSGFYSGTPVLDVSINGGPRISFANTNAGHSGFINWQQFSHQFTATAPTTMVTFFNGTSAGNVNELGLDDISLTAIIAIPEPETYALLLAGLGLIGFVARRRKKAS